jgi:hypothetical protein
MSVSALPVETEDDVYTLHCVRADGVASMFDLVVAEDLPQARSRAEALLREHLSCHTVEVWRRGAMVEQVER